MDDTEKFVEQTAKGARNFADMNRSAEGMSISFAKVIGFGAGLELMRKAMTEMVERSRTVQSIKKAMMPDNLVEHDLLVRQKTLTAGRINAMQVLRTQGLLGTEIHKRTLEAYRQQNYELIGQIRLVRTLNDVGKVTIGIATAMVGLMGDLWMKSRQLNQNLIEANALWTNRVRLVYSTLLAQAQLGVSFGKATDAARALVSYGLDTEQTFKANLDTVIMLEQGLGISVHTAATLATVVERQVKGSFQGVADVLAQLVDDTTLAGEEAAKLANTIGVAVGRLKPGLGAAGFPEVIKLVGRYESALKEVGGVPGAFQDLVTKMTTSEGITGAGALGVNPDFLATSQGVQLVMDRFADYGKMIVGQAQGWDRQMRLEALAAQFNTSADAANQMLMAIERANKQVVGDISLQERWRRQIHATDEGWTRLTNSFIAIAQMGLYPLVVGINAVINWFADAVNWITKNQYVLYVAASAVAVTMLATTVGLYRVGRALLAVAFTSNLAAAAAQRLAAANALQNAQKLLGVAPTAGPSLLGLLGKQFTGGWTMLLAPLKAIAGFTGLAASTLAVAVAGIAWLGYLGYRIWAVNKKSQEDQEASRKIVHAKSLSLQEAYAAKVYREARFGGPEGVAHALNQLRQEAMVRARDTSEGAPSFEQKIADLQESQAILDTLGTSVAKGLLTKSMFETLSERSTEEITNDDAIRKTAEDQLTTVKKSLSEQQKQLEEQKAESERRAIREAQERADSFRRSHPFY